MDIDDVAPAATITCDTCGEELDWQAGYTLVHHGGTVGYLHFLVADEHQPKQTEEPEQ